MEKTKASQAERELQRRVEAHTGRRISDWKASCTSYLPRDANRQPVVVAVLSEKPYSRFVATGKTITETDHGFDALLDKVKSYTRKSQAYAKGVEYDLADFRTRVVKHCTISISIITIPLICSPPFIVNIVKHLITSLSSLYHVRRFVCLGDDHGQEHTDGSRFGD